MAEPLRYVHIGLPKCASTSLQNSFFSNHSELFHLGSGYNSITGRYRERDIARVVEVDLRFKKECLWAPDRVGAVFSRYFEQAAETESCRAVGLSSEFLGFTLGNEIDTAAKAKRLYQVFGPGTRIIIVVRKQMDLLRSLYTEMIKGGYPGSYRNFLEYTLLYQDRNWCHDFCYDQLIDLYRGLFGAKQVTVIPFEQLQNDEAGFIQRLCDGLGISNTGQKLDQKNVLSALAELELLRRFNEKWPHEFGSPFFQPFQSTRMRAYFEDELGVKVPLERNIDDLMRTPLGDMAREKLTEGNIPELDLAVPAALGDRLEAIYQASNARLAGLVDFDPAGYGY